MCKKKPKQQKDKKRESIPWNLQVYRNKNNLCWKCGKPATTTVFFDVPVCDKHKDER